jgi:hypothetical protein
MSQQRNSLTTVKNDSRDSRSTPGVSLTELIYIVVAIVTMDFTDKLKGLRARLDKFPALQNAEVS